MRSAGLLVLLVVAAAPAAAQSGRQALAAGNERYLLADYRGAAPLLAHGVDPKAGPQDRAWQQGVQRLADVLLVLRNDSLATTWLRWASRLSPGFTVDEETAPPAVVRAARAARAFVDSTPGDAYVATTEFGWPNTPAAYAPGTVRLAPASIPVTARVGADQFLRSAESRRLPPGSYEVVASAPGYLPTRLTLEVLPGIETLIRVSLLPETSGLLYVAARPWATLFVDGRRVGYTSVAGHRVAPGRHLIEMTRASNVTRDTTLVIAPHARMGIAWVPRRDSTGSGRIDAALSRLDLAETERGATMLDDALEADQASLAPPVRARALARLAEALWALGARDSARSRLRDAVRADPFYTPPADLLNPDVAAAYAETRRQTAVIGLKGPLDTVLDPLRDSLPVSMAVGSPGEVRLLLRLTSPASHDSLLAVVAVDSQATARIPLASADGRALPPGEYAIEGALAAAGTGASALLQLTIQRTPVDTAAHMPPLPDTAFRPETRRVGANLRNLRDGLGLGALSFLVSAAANSPGLSGRSVPPASVLVGGSVALATVILKRPEVQVPENVQYNRSLRAAWEARDRAIAADNAALLGRAPLRVRTRGEP